LHALRRKLAGAAPPRLVRLPHRAEYGMTYLLDMQVIQEGSLAPVLVPLAQAFHGYTEPPEGIALLCDLFDEEVDALTLRWLFAGLVTLMGTDALPGSALNPPIQSAEPLGSAFRLHADLFRETMLMSVFDRVPSDHTGACVLLDVPTFRQILEGLESMPFATRERILELIEDRNGEDRFDELFHHMHHPSHPWADELLLRTRSAQFTLQPRRGQGYVVDDRRWLHGREPQSCRVETDRLYRVVFETRHTLMAARGATAKNHTRGAGKGPGVLSAAGPLHAR
jgi:hypothetical protein